MKDCNPPNMVAQISGLGLGPLSIQGPRESGDQEVQVSDLENPNDLQSLQPGRRPSDQQPQFNIGLISPDIEAQDSLSDEPMGHAGCLSFVVDFILGHNKSNPIWRLRLLSAFCLYIAAVVGILFYPDNLPEAQAPYHQGLMLTTCIGAPIVVAVISLFVSFGLESVSNNWITGLLIANISMLCGPLVVYWAHKQGTGK
ncbi:hypothetical protein FCM35_KLT17327 [Carex littledalei]|uniref:Uncharacterized protein n=1 Tax=Carex littledalei TaxID=544730 RepID=A0A833VRB5_9POAL|nr:hypothetical protein FCM35_KLT17327 [Carex littledalei]